jgi:predicted permease
MTWFGEMLRRLGTLFRRGRFHRDLSDEIRHHLDLKTQSGLENGMPAEEARHAAEREFGNSLLLRERGRDAWGWVWIDRLGQDLRYAWRQLRRSPGFAIVATLTLALGIGANAVIFSAVNAVILNPLPFRDAGGILTAWVSSSRGVDYAGPAVVCGAYYQEWQKQNQLFAEVGGFNGRTANFTGRGTPERLIGSEVTASLFPLLRVSPAFGRAFSTADEEPAHASVVLLSDRLWRSRFASDRGVIGQSVKLDGQFFTVAGVMPPGFGFPNDADFWTPLVSSGDCQPPPGHNASTRLLVRLQRNVPIERARGEVGVLSADLDRRNQIHGPAGTNTTLVPLGYEIAGDFRTPLLVLFGAVGLVLLIACVNVANLLLARSASRQREIAIRSALGAGRARVIRQMITESILLGALGGALGLFLAYGGYPLVASAASRLPQSFFGSPAAAARMASAGIDGRVLGFTLALSLLTGLLFGLAPALRASRPDLARGMNQRTSDSGAGVARRRFQDVLVAAEVALALIVLIGAGLLIRSFLALVNVDPGFAPENVLTVNLSLPESRYETPARMIAFERQALDRLSGLPGTRAAGVIFGLPLGDMVIQGDITVEGAPPSAPGALSVQPSKHIVGGDYFRAAGIPLRKGRAFNQHDTAASPHVLMVSESVARHFWPHDDPIGKHLDPGFSDAGWYTVVGVAGDVKQFGPADSESFAIYLPYEQSPVPFLMRDLTLVMRTATDPLKAVPAARRALEGVDPELPLFDVASMEQLVYQSVARPRFNAALLAIFAGLALILATVGIYGVMSYMVTERTHEIGVRMALGAQAGDVLRGVVAQGAARAAAGIALGLVGALFLTRFLTTLLFGVRPTDAPTFVAVAALLGSVALVASYLPARRATRIDPMAALRCE